MLQLINNHGQDTLNQRGVKFLLATGENHKFLGLCEQTVWNAKKALARLFPHSNSSPDVFSFIHRLSIVEQYLNDRPTFAQENTYFFSDMFRVVTLQHAKRNDNQILSDLFLPSSQTMRDAVSLLCKDSQ